MKADADANQSSNSAEKELFESSKPRDTLVGTTLDGRFYIEEVLGSGGMSVVYKARQLRVDRHVAIKTIRTQVDTKPVYRERFQREINSLCALSHPNIVTVYDCLIGDNEQPYVVMDYLRGRSLEALIKEDGPISVERFARITVQICSALTHAHRKGIIHRDLKPGNVVLMDDEMDFVKVVDFGLAKIGEENRKLTRSGELWGSPPYMSPEQCMGKSGDVRSDIYSMGVVMYEMLTGKDPFHNSAAVFELIQLHINSPPPSFSSINSNVSVPSKVEEVVLKALAKDPDHRYQNAEQLQEAIVGACSSSATRDSGDLLVHIPIKGRSGEQNAPRGSTYGEPAGKYFDRALDPMAGEDLEMLFASGGGAEPGGAAAAGAAPGAAGGTPAVVNAPSVSAAAQAAISPPRARTSNDAAGSAGTAQAGAGSVNEEHSLPLIEPEDLRWKNPEVEISASRIRQPTPEEAAAAERKARAASRESANNRANSSGRLSEDLEPVSSGSASFVKVATTLGIAGVIGLIACLFFVFKPAPAPVYHSPTEETTVGPNLIQPQDAVAPAVAPAASQAPAQAPSGDSTASQAPAAPAAPAKAAPAAAAVPALAPAVPATTAGAGTAGGVDTGLRKTVRRKVIPAVHRREPKPSAIMNARKKSATTSKTSAPQGDVWKDLDRMR